MAATIVAVEIVLTLVGSATPNPPLYPGERKPPKRPQTDPLVGWKFLPHATVPQDTAEFSVVYRSYRQGFRSAWEFDEPTKHRRIFFLGDSFTMGSGVAEAETFASLLEQKLRGVRSYNFGMTWFGVDQMWMTLRHYGLPLEPDLVILCFVRDDLERSLWAYQKGPVPMAKPSFHLVEGGRLVARTMETRPADYWLFLRRHSRILERLRRAQASLSYRFAIGYRWRLNRAIFEQIRDEARASDVPLVVVYLPSNRRRPAPAFGREFARMGIDFLDLTPLLPAKPETLYYEHDGHFNAAGHRFAADAIHAFLVQRNLS